MLQEIFPVMFAILLPSLPSIIEIKKVPTESGKKWTRRQQATIYSSSFPLPLRGDPGRYFGQFLGSGIMSRVRSNTHSAKCSMTSTKDGVKGDLLKSWNTQVNIGQ